MQNTTHGLVRYHSYLLPKDDVNRAMVRQDMRELGCKGFTILDYDGSGLNHNMEYVEVTFWK